MTRIETGKEKAIGQKSSSSDGPCANLSERMSLVPALEEALDSDQDSVA